MPTTEPDAKTIVAVQLRLLPDERDRLRTRAALAGMQMSAYVRSLVLRDLDDMLPAKKTSKKS